MPSTSWPEQAVRGWLPYCLCLALSLALYANTFGHQFALDDDIVVCRNEHVLRGIRGLPAIFSRDLFDSHARQMRVPLQLSGGRYRPLSVATFALEQEFVGTRGGPAYAADCWDRDGDGRPDPEEDLNGDGVYNDVDCRIRGFALRHVDNVLLYAIAVCLLYGYLCSVVFPSRKPVALFGALFFLAHPVHVEVVANVKSRDEILAFLFVVLTLLLAHRCERDGGWRRLLPVCAAFLCALLSKESGVTLLALVPLSLHLFGKRTGRRVSSRWKILAGLALTFGLYVAVRSSIVIGHSGLQDAEILNNPYLLATPVQRWATKLFVFFKYLSLLAVPHPLSSDYGYRSVPYQDLTDPGPWLGVATLAGFALAGGVAIGKRHWLGFAVAICLLPLLLVGNVFFNVGTVMGERFLFQPSAGFCMALGFLPFAPGCPTALRRWATALALGVLGLFAVTTLARNRAWANDFTLALTDVRTTPESVLLNGNAAARTLDMAEWPVNAAKKSLLVQEAVDFAERAVRLHPGYVQAYFTLGLAHARTGKYDEARRNWGIAFALAPDHPKKARYLGALAAAYNRQGLQAARAGDWRACAGAQRKALELEPANERYQRDLRGCVEHGREAGH